MASGGLPLIADSRGLREAGSEAALRFNPNDVNTLQHLLRLISDKESRSWIHQTLSHRYQRRLSRLHPDLIGLALLAQARRCSL